MRFAVLPLFVAASLAACAGGSPDVDEEAPEEPAIPDPPDDPDDPGPPPLAGQLVPGCTATATLAGFPVWLHFTRPDRPCTGTPGSGLDRHVLNELTRLIRSVPAGGRIEGHIFSISVDSVAKALVDAEARGVTVRLSADGQVAASDDPSTDLLNQLGHVVYCGTSTNRACVSTAANAISHTKLFVFSTATAPDGQVAQDVVWFGSANQTYASGMRLYNNTVTIYGDHGLYTLLRGYLGDLEGQARTSDYYVPSTGRGHLLADAADVYVSPEVQTDLVVHRLDDFPLDSDCRVRVMQASVRDSRLDVVAQLVKMKRGGCKVWVVADTVEPDALAALHAANIPVHHMPIHDKSFLVRYRGDDGELRYRVFTGSHNLSGGSAHRFDEIFVKLAAEAASHPVYDAYFTHFNDAYDTGPAI